MERLVWVCIAGAVGTGCRYLISTWSVERLGVAFPYGTLIVNVVGCFFMAVVLRVALVTTAFPESLRIALTSGFLGGLTTYSAFNYETTKLLMEGRPLVAFTNVAVTLVTCFVAGVLGLFFVSRFTQS